MLTARNLRKSYITGPRQVSVIDGLHLEIPHGVFATIQGASGSGKSTLLHLLGGLDTPDEGDVQWRETSIFSLSSNQLSEWRNQSVGFIFQSYHLLHELSAFENVELPAMIQGKKDIALSEALLKKVGLEHRFDHRPLELSGGEQQRVAIARALRNRPQLLLADEPTGNLDRSTATEIIQLLLQIHQQEKMTTVLVTHDPEIAKLGDLRFLMENQKIRPLNE
ncbi:MAG: ABC transporter ATP-binding protein [Verrucomicrobiota bacterium]